MIGKRSRLLVAGRPASTSVRDGWAGLEIKSLLDHELYVRISANWLSFEAMLSAWLFLAVA
jgi:hypothetical protein